MKAALAATFAQKRDLWGWRCGWRRGWRRGYAIMASWASKQRVRLSKKSEHAGDVRATHSFHGEADGSEGRYMHRAQQLPRMTIAMAPWTAPWTQGWANTAPGPWTDAHAESAPTRDAASVEAPSPGVGPSDDLRGSLTVRRTRGPIIRMDPRSAPPPSRPPSGCCAPSPTPSWLLRAWGVPVPSPSASVSGTQEGMPAGTRTRPANGRWSNTILLLVTRTSCLPLALPGAVPGAASLPLMVSADAALGRSSRIALATGSAKMSWIKTPFSISRSEARRTVWSPPRDSTKGPSADTRKRGARCDRASGLREKDAMPMIVRRGRVRAIVNAQFMYAA